MSIKEKHGIDWNNPVRDSKYKEFRIGNFVSRVAEGTDYKAYEVVGVSILRLDLFISLPPKDIWYQDKIEDVIAIPLTEEWLVKFGFEKYGQSSGYTLWVHPSFTPYYRISCWDGKFRLVYKEGEQNPAVAVNLFANKYLHQLQNIFFALTGQELNIKS